ncbi:MAG: biopolymer transporter ExbD [Verrucomicrobiae bacterium]|nr:biopolymer transporter ExbD [Verrucomicrobiae bacterium]
MSASSSSKLRGRLFRSGTCQVDLSPMIDLVFLLLIFFMVSSTMITYRKDPNVTVPIATEGKVPGLVQGRVILNVYGDGTIKSEDGEKLTVDEVEARMRRAKQSDPGVRLHVRADQLAAHAKVKEVIDASARGGVANVIFSTYITDK